MKRLPALLVLFMSWLLLAGCASDKIYRSQYSPCLVAEQSCEKHALQKFQSPNYEYWLGFVEIDDQGQLRDRKQLQAVLDELYKIAAFEDVLINVFVHGWHHDARPGDGNIESFRQILQQLSRLESQRSAQKQQQPRKVFGVYVGWRGESIDFPGLRYLTFWDRKNTAEDVGYLGVTELLLKLEQVVHVKSAQDSDESSRLVVIGHSFGGAVVYNALSQILTNRFIDSHPGKNYSGQVQGFGDLVVLLNPAFEALQFAPLYDLAQSRCHYLDSRTPRLAILTSESDYATKYAFWAGQAIATVFETHNTIERTACQGKRQLILDEGEADRTAVGHFTPLLTHDLRLLENNKTTVQDPSDKNLQFAWKRPKEGQKAILGNMQLTHLGLTSPYNPYLNIRVSSDIIADHNDVFSNELLRFIQAMIVYSTMEQSAVRRQKRSKD